jgi:hypothetical protein
MIGIPQYVDSWTGVRVQTLKPNDFKLCDIPCTGLKYNDDNPRRDKLLSTIATFPPATTDRIRGVYYYVNRETIQDITLIVQYIKEADDALHILLTSPSNEVSKNIVKVMRINPGECYVVDNLCIERDTILIIDGGILHISMSYVIRGFVVVKNKSTFVLHGRMDTVVPGGAIFVEKGSTYKRYD